MKTSSKTPKHTPADALMDQVAEIQALIDRLEYARDEIHDSTAPDNATWKHVAAQAHVADLARRCNAELDEIERG